MRRLVPLLLLLILCAADAEAGVLYARRPGTESPLYPLRISQIRTTVTITDQLAVTHVDEEFFNDNNLTLEGFYAFQLPEGAKVNGLWLWENGQRKIFLCLRKEDAQRMYDSVVVGQRRDPAILESLGANRFQLKVFPIAPNSSRRVEIEYFHTLPLTPDGVVHYTYPLNMQGYQTTPVEATDMRIIVRTQLPLRDVVTSFDDRPMLCRVTHPDDNTALIQFGIEQQFYAQDFTLTFRPEGIFSSFPCLAWRDTLDNDPYFITWHPVQVDSTVDAGNRDLVLVLDASGSMAGSRALAVRQAVVGILGKLLPNDRFRLVLFSTYAVPYPSDSSMLFASPENVQRAVDYLNRNYDGNGGSTNYESAFREAFRTNFRSSSIRRMLFLTDGSPNAGWTSSTELLSLITGTDKYGVPIYPVLLYTSDITLLEQIAKARGGRVTNVENGDILESVIARILLDLGVEGFSAPAVTYLNGKTYHVLPRTFPHLARVDEIITTGRLTDDGIERATLTYVGADGKNNSITRDVDFYRHLVEVRHVGAYWASKRIDELLDEIRVMGETTELKNSVIALSIKHNILSPYTAFLVLETNQIDPPTGVDQPSGAIAGSFTLGAAFPNPLSHLSAGGTTIPFTIGASTTVRIVITDLLGRVVRVLVEGVRAPGAHAAVWDAMDEGGRPVAPGIYFVRMTAPGFNAMRKLVIAH